MLSLLSIDPSLGKIDKSTFSQLTLMELFIDGITNKADIYSDPERQSPQSDWPWVVFDHDGLVMEIFVPDHCRIHGSVSLEWLPETTRIVNINGNPLTGSLHLMSLPDGLREFSVTHCLFSGEVSLSNLPESLELMRLTKNELSGTLDFTHLPKSLKEFSAARNSFSGSATLTQLPTEMHALLIHVNSFSGTVDLTRLPPKMKFLNISTNGFHGETDFSKLPETLQGLDISNTELTGVVLPEYAKSISYFAYTNTKVQ
mmetsp:Transcript_23255/g.36251  ORF Transcript_23255/g.36251 Transcript_23255/m.36251 type:complete len:258 (-) Transcript_23255:101-874(-)